MQSRPRFDLSFQMIDTSNCKADYKSAKLASVTFYTENLLKCLPIVLHASLQNTHGTERDTVRIKQMQ